MRAKQCILDGKVEGVTMSEISDEDWAKEFDAINKSRKVGKGKKKKIESDDFISFREFVAYALKNIIKPVVYVANANKTDEEKQEEQQQEQEEEREETVENVEREEENQDEVHTAVSRKVAFVRMMSDLIDDMEEHDKVEEDMDDEPDIFDKEETEIEGGKQESEKQPPVEEETNKEASS